MRRQQLLLQPADREHLAAQRNLTSHRDIAMTGEITLRGKVLPIGGLKEKLLAAHRAGIFEAIVPEENRKDLADLPELLKTSMKLYFVEEMDQVLNLALEGNLPELREETPEGLAAVMPVAGIDLPQPIAHQ